MYRVFQFSWVHTPEVNCCMMPSLILYPAPPPLILHKVQSQGGSLHPQAHGFRGFAHIAFAHIAVSPEELFSLILLGSNLLCYSKPS